LNISKKWWDGDGGKNRSGQITTGSTKKLPVILRPEVHTHNTVKSAHIINATPQICASDIGSILCSQSYLLKL